MHSSRVIPNEKSWQQINSENKGEMLNFHPQIPIKNHAEKVRNEMMWDCTVGF